MDRLAQLADLLSMTSVTWVGVVLGLVWLQALAPRAALVAAEVTGAVIDEDSIATTIVVDGQGRVPGSEPTIAGGLRAAKRLLDAGTPTRVRIHAGTYRESAADIALGSGAGANVLLVIESANDGVVRWTGADPLTGWRDEGGGRWSASWPYRMGVACDPWGLGQDIGPRRELAFRGELPLRPTALDRFQVEGLGAWADKPVTFTFLGNAEPAAALSPGSFGVMEEGPGSGRIWLQLPEGESPDQIEVAVRDHLLDIVGKRGLVVRGIIFERCAVGQRFGMYDHPIQVGNHSSAGAGDVLIDRCTFRWHAGTGLRVHGYRWTVRDTHCDNNGLSGIAGDRVRNLRFERCTTNGNCWREFMSGFDGDWCFAAFKLAETAGHAVLDHQSIGNAGHGMWWDVHCTDIEVDGAILAYNRRSFQFELSHGPFTGRRILAMGARQAPQANGGDSCDPAAVFSCAGTASVTSSVIWTETCDEVFGISWYERDSPHFRLRPLVPDLFTVTNSVLMGGGRVDAVIREENVGDRSAPGWHSLRYRGSGNTFWHPATAQPFAWHAADWKRQGGDLKTWSQRTGESNARWEDPGFLAPAVGDFRVRSDSPLAARTDLPLLRIDPTMLATARAHYAWMGWGRERFAAGTPRP